MSIASIASSYTSPKATTKTTGSSDTIGKTDFLKLLVTQIQKQDPLNPQDPSEFTSQLTQFSSLEQLMGVNTNIQGLSSQQSLDSRIAATGFIGKTTQIKGDLLGVNGGSASTVQYTLGADGQQVSMNVYDPSGALLRVVDLGQQKTGTHDFKWDGKTTTGQQVADGAYRFEVTAQDATNQPIMPSTSFKGQVTGVSFDGANTMLDIGGYSWSIGDMIAVGQGA